MRKVIGNFIINTFVCLWFGIVIGAGVAWGVLGTYGNNFLNLRFGGMKDE